MSEVTGKHWYLVQCKPRQDLRALEHLERQGYQCLLAMHQVELLCNGQLKKSNELLFPGYLFIHLDKVEDNWLPIRSTRGVNQIVGFGGYPTIVPDTIIDRINQRDMTPAPALIEGERVHLDQPNLNQLDAIFIARDGDERVMLLLNILRRKITVSVPISRVRKIQ